MLLDFAYKPTRNRSLIGETLDRADRIPAPAGVDEPTVRGVSIKEDGVRIDTVRVRGG